MAIAVYAIVLLSALAVPGYPRPRRILNATFSTFVGIASVLAGNLIPWPDWSSLQVRSRCDALQLGVLKPLGFALL